MAEETKRGVSLPDGKKKIGIILCAVLLIAVCAAVITVTVKRHSGGDATIPAQKLTVFVDKFPETAQETLNLLNQKISVVQHENKEKVSRTYALALSDPDQKLQTPQRTALTYLSGTVLPQLSAGFLPKEINYGENTAWALPDLSALPLPEEYTAECTEDGVFQLTLRYGAAAKNITSEESAGNMNAVIAGFSDIMEVKSSAFSAKDAVIYAEINGTSGILRRLDIRVGYQFSLDGTFTGKHSNYGDQTVAFRLTEETDYRISRAGVYFGANVYYIPQKGTHSLDVSVNVPEGFTAEDYKITYTSSDERVLTVDENGVITPRALSEKSVTVTAMLEYTKETGVFFDVCDVYVTVPVKGVSLSNKELSLAAGQTQTLTAGIAPQDATIKNIIWMSEDEAVATVDENGLVTAVAPGETKIIAVTEDGHYSKSCVVTVTAP